MRKASQKDIFLANMEVVLNIIFIKNKFAYITIFFISIYYLNLTQEEQLFIIEKYTYPGIITIIYFIIATIVDNYSNNIKVIVQKTAEVKKLVLSSSNREDVPLEKLTKYALHEASHFIAFLKEDFENFSEIKAYIHKVYANSDNKYQGNTLESIYNNAFIRYISFVVEKKYFTSSWEGFTNSNDFKEFELLTRTYLLNSKNVNFFINPINEIEAAYNAKLINELKEQIEKECEIYIDEYEDFLMEVKNILIKRDIETIEAKELLLKWKKKIKKNDSFNSIGENI